MASFIIINIKTFTTQSRGILYCNFSLVQEYLENISKMPFERLQLKFISQDAFYPTFQLSSFLQGIFLQWCCTLQLREGEAGVTRKKNPPQVDKKAPFFFFFFLQRRRHLLYYLQNGAKKWLEFRRKKPLFCLVVLLLPEGPFQKPNLCSLPSSFFPSSTTFSSLAQKKKKTPSPTPPTRQPNPTQFKPRQTQSTLSLSLMGLAFTVAASAGTLPAFVIAACTTPPPFFPHLPTQNPFWRRTKSSLLVNWVPLNKTKFNVSCTLTAVSRKWRRRLLSCCARQWKRKKKIGVLSLANCLCGPFLFLHQFSVFFLKKHAVHYSFFIRQW